MRNIVKKFGVALLSAIVRLFIALFVRWNRWDGQWHCRRAFGFQWTYETFYLSDDDRAQRKLSVRGDNYLTTTFYMRPGGAVDWHSEHVAYWWGDYYEMQSHGCPPEWWNYSGWLGNHTYV